jgi:hypothetical protein
MTVQVEPEYAYVRTHGSISSWVGENMGTLMEF